MRKVSVAYIWLLSLFCSGIIFSAKKTISISSSQRYQKMGLLAAGYLAGAACAYKQLPFLAAKTMYGNHAIFSKTLAGLLFSMGAAISLGSFIILLQEISETISLNPDVSRIGKKIAFAIFLLVGGSALAYKQLERLRGNEIFYDAPLFTKFLSSCFFGIGLSGIIGSGLLFYLASLDYLIYGITSDLMVSKI